MLLIALLLPAMFALAVLAINIAHMESTNTEMQIAVDAAARAAGRTYNVTGSRAEALAAAREAAARNPIGTYVLPISAGDLQIGDSDRAGVGSMYSFTPKASNGNAIRITTTSLNSGSVAGIEPLFPFFASAFTVRPLLTATSTQSVIDIALVVDRSGSMAYGSSEVAAYPPAPTTAPAGWTFGDPVPMQARWLDLIAAVKRFTDELSTSPQEELLSLSLYNHATTTPQTLTTDYALVIDRLNDVSANFSAGGTAIGSGIYEGLNAVNDSGLSRPFASKVLIVMTDGVQNHGPNPRWAAQAAADGGVTVFTITFSDEAEEAAMMEVAEIGGGEHFHAATAAELANAFRNIADRLPTLLTQ